MRKALATALAALTITGAFATGAAEARPHRHYSDTYRNHDRRGDDGAWVAAGIAGLAIGAALASSGSRGHGQSYDYESSGYYPRYREHRRHRPYAVCEDRRWVYDPYIERHVMIRDRYAC